ncbi:zinc finger protein [Plasmodium brasilianum]|uniref:U1 small nuclear ribonucleoprotein C, putative n=2 Tax=Plasmodium (Plasmodium) TaxID=418103 RepID=A0A1A8WFK6_PLAMA|nr:U1 small nuclear ribonucleoprotein C, putative [Plasmodium malariae]KAI4835973.1 zinc finger protein [Plasmodium brasilianum]SBS89976.1 conserved Plasmodium protein, unknown function [Plasmodium malariae]SCP02911.1 U1 small nuclear ribonucleoprotein C, putative [Plasmodium malariae]
MTDYWVSSKKHYCETCNCWISGHKVNIKNHERSTRHIENFKNLLNKSFKRREQETKDKEFIEKELKKLENVEKKFLSDLQKNDISNKSNSSINLNTCHSNNKNRISNSSNNITSNNVTNYVSSGQGNNKKWVVMIHEDTGSLLFYNRLKNGITYEKPKDFFDYLPEYETFSEQNGWFKYFDYNSNNFYYYNIYSSKSIWQYSVNTISSLINYINQCDEITEKNKNFSNPNENKVYSTKLDVIPNQENLNRSGYYESHFQNSAQNSYYGVNNNLNLLNREDEITVEDKGQEEKIQMILTPKKEIDKLQSNSKNNIINVTTERTGSSGNYEDINNAFSFNSCEQNCRDAKSTMVESTCKSDERDVKYAKCEKDKTYMNEENITNGGNNFRGESKLDKKSEKTYYTNIEEEKQLNKNNLDIGNKNKNTNISMFYKKADSTVSIPDDKKKKIHNKKENIEKTDKPNTQEQIEEGGKVKIDLISKPGAWESVEDSEINTISNEKIEQIFYNIKSKEEIEKEEITQLEEDIRYEYSAHNEFYVKKKELENEDIFLNQEFKFVSKPIYKKAIDKNLNKKVEFAKRSIKSIQNKKKIS